MTCSQALEQAANRVREALASTDTRTAERDDLIREAVREHGMSYREVARCAGISHVRVQQILARTTV